MEATNDPGKTNDATAAGEAGAFTLREINELLKPLPDWRFVPGTNSIRAEFKTKNFRSAAYFIGEVVPLADAMDHHPDVHLTGYRNLAFELTTHEAKGLTDKDFALAARISKEFAKFSDPLQELQKQRETIVNYKSGRRTP